MNLDQVRLGALFVPTTALWTGSVSAWDSDTFTLTVTTSTGSLSDVAAGLAVAWEGQYIRIRAVDSGAGTIALAETGADIEASDSVSVYAPRLPFPRYQYIDSDGNVYKDYDIAWSSAAATLPPRAWIWAQNPSGDGGYSEAIWTQTGTAITVVATASLVMSAEATTGALTYLWESDGDATIGSSASSSTTVSWSSTGFRYLKLTVTDDQGISAVRYIPVWVGNASLVDARALSLDWEATRGWRAQVQLDSLSTYLRGAPVAIVDLETADVIYLGWHYPGQWTQDFEITSIEFELRGAFGYAESIYSYPFIIEDVDTPSEWAHVSELTLERAVWYLLYWHSTLTQIANVGPGTAPDNRRIAGQEFTAGTLANQLTELSQAAFRYVTGYRSGGFALYEHPLYMLGTEFDGLTSIDLSAQTALLEQIDIEQAQPEVAEARLSGVYYGVGDDEFKPIIARGPTHPLPWGNTEEVTNLAPLTQTEILQWAARHIALRNSADRYTVRPRTLDVLPADGRVLDLPDSVRIALEEVRLSYNVEALAWDAEAVGHTFGNDVSVAVEPPPPAIEPPAPGAPGTPWLPPLPEPGQWGDGNIVAFTYKASGGSPQVYITENFLSASPTWTDISGNLSTLGAGSPWFIDFAQGGDVPYGLYLSTKTQMFYCADPPNTTTWIEISPPSGYEFRGDVASAEAPRIMASPAADGQMLCNIYETGTHQRWAWIFTGAGNTVNLFYTGYQYSWYSYNAYELHWNPDGDHVLAGAFRTSGADNNKHILQIPKTASIVRSGLDYDTFISTYQVCSGATTSPSPSWITNRGLLSFPAVGAIIGSVDYDVGVAGPDICTTYRWLDADSGNDYGPSQYLDRTGLLHRIGVHPLLGKTAILTSYDWSGAVRFTTDGFAGGLSSTKDYPVGNVTHWSRNWLLLPKNGSQPVGVTFGMPGTIAFTTRTDGYVYAFDLTTEVWTLKNGAMGTTGWENAGSVLSGARQMASFWGYVEGGAT